MSVVQLLLSPVNITSMADLNDHDNEAMILDLVNDPIIALSNSVIFHAR